MTNSQARNERLVEIGSWERADLRWRSIASRCDCHPSYFSVKFLLERDQFISWFRSKDFLGCEVDRIDNHGHYEISNIQLLSKEQHLRKSTRDRLAKFSVFFELDYLCVTCDTYKSWDSMNKDNRRVEGVSRQCGHCVLKKQKVQQANRKAGHGTLSVSFSELSTMLVEAAARPNPT